MMAQEVRNFATVLNLWDIGTVIGVVPVGTGLSMELVQKCRNMPQIRTPVGQLIQRGSMELIHDTEEKL